MRVLTVFVRSVILFLAAVAAMRLMGKRQVGQLQPYEMVVVIMIAELAATPMGGVGVPLLYGVVPMAALVACHGLISALCVKSRRFRRWVSGEPTVLIRRGAICEDALSRLCLTLDDIGEALRSAGVPGVGQVETAVMEPSGVISVFPKAEARPVTPSDLGLTPEQEALPLPLIADGQVLTGNLRRCGLEAAWLDRQLAALGYAGAKQVLFLCLETGGKVLAQGRGEDAVRTLHASDAERAVW